MYKEGGEGRGGNLIFPVFFSISPEQNGTEQQSRAK